MKEKIELEELISGLEVDKKHECFKIFRTGKIEYSEQNPRPKDASVMRSYIDKRHEHCIDLVTIYLKGQDKLFCHYSEYWERFN